MQRLRDDIGGKRDGGEVVGPANETLVLPEHHDPRRRCSTHASSSTRAAQEVQTGTEPDGQRQERRVFLLTIQAARQPGSRWNAGDLGLTLSLAVQPVRRCVEQRAWIADGESAGSQDRRLKNPLRLEQAGERGSQRKLGRKRKAPRSCGLLRGERSAFLSTFLRGTDFPFRSDLARSGERREEAASAIRVAGIVGRDHGKQVARETR